jgi:hypothetical protein
LAVLASTRPPTLTKDANFAAPFAGSGQKSLDASHEVRSRQLQNLGKLEDCCKRWAVFAALQQAYVLGVIPALEGKRFLREMTVLSQLTEDPRKRTLLWRAWFGPGWHPQLEVCGVSINTSTKYSIPSGIGCFLGNAIELYGLEGA